MPNEQDNQTTSVAITGDERCHNLSLEENVDVSSSKKNSCEKCNKDLVDNVIHDCQNSNIIVNGKTSSIEPKRKRDSSLCALKILQKKDECGIDENCIVQPERVIPKDQYLRRRSYSKQHMAIWKDVFKKNKYIKCMFQHCHFIALSIEDMVIHFGHCNGDGTFAKYICPYCEGRVTSEKFLEIHIRRSHASMADRTLVNVGTVNESDSRSADYEDGEVLCDVYINEYDDVLEEHEHDPFLDDEIIEFSFDSEESEGEGSSSLACDSRKKKKKGKDSASRKNSEDDIDFSCDADYQDQESSDVRPGARNKKCSAKKGKNANGNHKNYKKKRKNGQENTSPFSNEKSSDSRFHEESKSEDEADKDNAALDQEDNGKDSELVNDKSKKVKRGAKKRKILPWFYNTWEESIKKNGFARCLLATCNFISLNLFHIKNHFKNCDGTPADGPNLCESCGSWLPSAMEQSIHSSLCKASADVSVEIIFDRGDGGANAEKGRDIDGSVENASTESGAGDPCNRASGRNQCSVQRQISRGSEPESTAPEKKKRKKEIGALYISDILKLKNDGARDVDMKRIIQCGPPLLKGQYLRRRGYTKRHKAAWEQTLKKHHYVKCIFQNCHFVAMSVEDMIYHFGYCIGDGSFAKFECPYCRGRLTARIYLDIHIKRSHPEKLKNKDADSTVIEEENYNPDKELTEVSELKKGITKKGVKTYVRNSTEPNTVQPTRTSLEKDDSEVDVNPNSQSNRTGVNETNASLEGHLVRGTESDATTSQQNPHLTSASESESKSEEPKIVKRKRGRPPKTKNQEAAPCSDVNMEEVLNEGEDSARRMDWSADTTEERPCEACACPMSAARRESFPTFKNRRRGRPPKQVSAKVTSHAEGCPWRNQSHGADDRSDTSIVECAKCGFLGTISRFQHHNYRRHTGLSWIVGEEPVDPNDEEKVSWCIRQAFKYVKSATCESCMDVKKSALGFITHLQKCGKSEEEKEALKIQCPSCPSRILKYSFPMHMKQCHSGEVGKRSRELATDEALEGPPSKRKSALRAVDKLQEALKGSDDEEKDTEKRFYVLYEKNVSQLPKIPSKVRGLWLKMRKENKNIPCRRGSCLVESSNIMEAKLHHFMCSELPEKCYVCLMCDYYSTTEIDIQNHVNIHPKFDEDFTVGSEEERAEEEFDLRNDIIFEEGEFWENRSKRFEFSSEDSALEAGYKAAFFEKEYLSNRRQKRFCRRTLEMTLESEMEEVERKSHSWMTFSRDVIDWVPAENAADHFPSLEESMSFCVKTKRSDDVKWRKLKRFQGEVCGDSQLMFTGGSILAMSWLRTSCVRSCKEDTKQYLAVSSSLRMDKFQDVHKPMDNPSGLIQIWDCGNLWNLTNVDTPRMAVGILHDSGNVWDLSWFPLDTYNKSVDEKVMTTIGILGAACQDGTIRIWSVCDPSQLDHASSVPMCRVEPNVILVPESKLNEGCLRFAFGKSGIAVGGFSNGLVAVWSLKNVSSPFRKNSGKSFVLKPHLSFQAHRTSITAVSVCSNNDRYITTSGLDRYIKFWDLESTANPFEVTQREVCLDHVWPKHWPVTIATFEDVQPNSGKGMIKAIRDVHFDKHGAPLAMDSTCWSLSFNDWLNVLCGCNHDGEVRIRHLRNMYAPDEKFRLRTGDTFSAAELKYLREVAKEDDKGGEKSNSPSARNYEEASRYFGLVLHEYHVSEGKEKATQRTQKSSSLEEYPITSVNKVCWNPNYQSFLHLAVGHHCGIVSVRSLKDCWTREDVLQFYRVSNDAHGGADPHK